MGAYAHGIYECAPVHFHIRAGRTAFPALPLREEDVARNPLLFMLSAHPCAVRCATLSLWNDLKCGAKLGYTCQRPVKTKTHELQIISLTHVCAGIKPVREGLEQCLKTRVDGSCDYDSLSSKSFTWCLCAVCVVLG